MNNFNKYFVAASGLLFAFYMYMIGYSFGTHHIANGIADIVLAALWAGGYAGALRLLRSERMARLGKAFKDLNELTDKLIEKVIEYEEEISKTSTKINVKAPKSKAHKVNVRKG